MQPIIPLVGSAANPQELAPWPVGKLEPVSYQHGVAARFRAIVELETAGSRPKRSSAISALGRCKGA